MAEEVPQKKEEAPAAPEVATEATNAPAPSGKGKLLNSPWVPVVVMIILLPVLSLLLTEFILIPRMKRVLGDASATPTQATDSEKKDDKGKKGDGKESSKSIAFNDITANLAGSLQSRYIKVSFTAEGSAVDFSSLVEENRVRIVDATLTILSALTLNQLEEPGIKNTIRSDMLNLFETVLGKRVVEQIYFSEFVVQ